MNIESGAPKMAHLTNSFDTVVVSSPSTETAITLAVWLDVGPPCERADVGPPCEWAPVPDVCRSSSAWLPQTEKPVGWSLHDDLARSGSSVSTKSKTPSRRATEPMIGTEQYESDDSSQSSICERGVNKSNILFDRVPSLVPEEVAVVKTVQGLRSSTGSDFLHMVAPPLRRRSFTIGSKPSPRRPDQGGVMRPLAPMELIQRVVTSLTSEDMATLKSAASDIKFLVNPFLPKGILKVGFWAWSASSAEENRTAFGQIPGLWENLRRLIKMAKVEVTSVACEAAAMLVHRHDENTLAFATHPGMLDALTDLLDGSKHDYLVQVQGWRVLQICVGSVEEIKEVVCGSDRLLAFMRDACTCSMEEIRMNSISIVLHCASNEKAKANLLKADIPGRALVTVVHSSEEAIATRIRATLACAMLQGQEESSIISKQPDLLWQIVSVLKHALMGSEYAGVRWSLSSVMLPLFNLSCSDTNKGDLIKRGTVPLLLQVVRQGNERRNETIFNLALRTLANLTFDDDAKEQMVQLGAVSVLQAVSERSMEDSREDSLGAKQVLHDLVFLLTGGQNVEVQYVPALPEDVARSHVMLSYSPSTNTESVRMLGAMLKERGFDLWDYENGSTLVGPERGTSMATMSEAIEVAEYVIVFISKAYRDSYKCKLEGKYAQGRERAGLTTIIYVMLEADYHPDCKINVDGWLGMMIGESEWHKGWDKSFLDQVADAIDCTVRCGSMQCMLHDNGNHRKGAPEPSEINIGRKRQKPPSLDVNSFARNLESHVSETKAVDHDDAILRSQSQSSTSTTHKLPPPPPVGSSRNLVSPPRLTFTDSFTSDYSQREMEETSTCGSPSSATSKEGVDDFTQRRRWRRGSAESITTRNEDSFTWARADVSRKETFSNEAEETTSHWKRGARSNESDDSGASRHDESLNAKPVEFLRTDSPSTLKREELISSNSNSGSLDEGRRSNVEEVLGSRRKPLGNDDSLGVMVTETSTRRRPMISRQGSQTSAVSWSALSISGPPSASDAVHTRLKQHMVPWLADNNLEVLKDVFLFHAIDEPSLACQLTSEQIDQLTDKVGLRIRLKRALEKHRTSLEKHQPISSPLMSSHIFGQARSKSAEPSRTDSPLSKLRSDQSARTCSPLSRQQHVDLSEAKNEATSAENEPESGGIVLVGTGRLFAF